MRQHRSRPQLSSLPKWLRQPVKFGVLSLPEADQFYRLWKRTPAGESIVLPPQLRGMAEKLYLWERHPPTQSKH